MQTQYATQSATLAANADDVRVETLLDRDHVVAPVTLVREMVLKGELLPFDEIQATQLAWNAKPGTITHPTTESGDFVPASHPDRVESHVVGQLFDVETSAVSNGLEGEIWIDQERSAVVADALNRDDPAQMLLDGETVEVSVGYWYNRFEADGSHDGDTFDAVQVGIQPDHLALLPNGTGECSVKDGCGAGRDDAAGAALAGVDDSTDVNGGAASAPIALSLLQRGAERLGLEFAGACEDEDCGGACNDDNENADEVEANEHEEDEEGEEDSRADDDPDDTAASTDSDGADADDSGGDGGDGGTEDSSEKSTMNDKITQLAEQSEFDAEVLEEWDESQLEALEATIAHNQTTDDSDDSSDEDDSDEPSADGQSAQGSADTDASADTGTDIQDGGVAELADQISEQVLGKVDNRLEEFEKQQTAEERKQLAAQITTHSSLESDELPDDLEVLEKLANELQPQSGLYAGAAGASPASLNGTEDDDTEPLGATLEKIEEARN